MVHRTTTNLPKFHDQLFITVQCLLGDSELVAKFEAEAEAPIS